MKLRFRKSREVRSQLSDHHLFKEYDARILILYYFHSSKGCWMCAIYMNNACALLETSQISCA
jgi:hypothetical protein